MFIQETLYVRVVVEYEVADEQDDMILKAEVVSDDRVAFPGAMVLEANLVELED